MAPGLTTLLYVALLQLLILGTLAQGGEFQLYLLGALRYYSYSATFTSIYCVAVRHVLQTVLLMSVD